MYKGYQNFLALVLSIVTSLFFSHFCFSENVAQPLETKPQILSGENAINDIKIFKDAAGVAKAKIDYYYTGKPQFVTLSVEAKIRAGDKGRDYPDTYPAEIGKNSIEVEVQNPIVMNEFVTVTQAVRVTMNIGLRPVLIEKEVPYVYEWGTTEETEWRKKIATSSVNQLYEESVKLIDGGNSKDAKRDLEQIVLKDPTFAPAYVELGRAAMGTSESREKGLSQAEKYILTALQLNPADGNANILIGYVYTHQNRFTEAEKSFNAAEKIGTKNLWLWANWGELLAAQEKNSEAIKKYLVAVDGARPYNTYDRARLDAYKNLFILLNNSSDQDKKDALYKKRETEFDNACFIQEHAKFKLTALNDYKSAIDLAKLSIDRGCTDEKAKAILGLAHYFSWINSADDFSLLAKAKIFYPEGPELFYDLVKTETGIKVIKKLIKNGTPIDVPGAENRTALALALFNKDSISARKLISLGADVNLTLGEEKFPIAFIPLMFDDQKSFALMKESGVDYQKVKFRGRTAGEYMQQKSTGENGNKNL